MNKDRVLVAPSRSRGPRRAGRIIRILERASSEIIGVLREGWGQPYILSGERHTEDNFKILSSTGRHIDNLPYGHKISAKITRYPTKAQQGEARLEADFGIAGSIEAETAAIIREYGLREEFPQAVNDEAEALPESVPEEELRKRIDYCQQRCITIDPPDAADFDDAICLTRTDQGLRLHVHIADVAWAVPAGSALDKEARERSTSVYLPGHVLPMLPHRLSSLFCSLVPGQPRLTQTAVIDFSPEGERLSCVIERSVIRSALRLHYGQVRRLIEGSPEPGEEVPDWAMTMLKEMHEFSQKLRARRFKAGAIFLDMPEIRVRVGDDGETLGIEEHRQNFSHQIVEEFMLAANRAVAEFMVAMELPGIYRIHEPPDEDKLNELAGFVATYGLNFKPPFNRRKLQKLLQDIAGQEYAPAVTFAVLTSLRQARYSAAEEEHYALAFRPYCHFTSPIRRYPDLIVHRALAGLYPPDKARLDGIAKGGRRKGWRAKVGDRKEANSAMEGLARHCSAMERNAAEAERNLTRFRQMELLDRNKYDEHCGLITNVTDFGIFVRLDGFYVEGLVHVASMSDRYRFNASRRELVGQRTGRRWRQGEQVAVRIVSLDLATARLELELA